jgi:hypothetical protein
VFWLVALDGFIFGARGPANTHHRETEEIWDLGIGIRDLYHIWRESAGQSNNPESQIFPKTAKGRWKRPDEKLFV